MEIDGSNKIQENIHIGDIVSNSQMCEIFKCSPQGGMRRSRKTNTLIIVSDHTKGLYEDRWINNILHYTGMGQKGDQDVKWMQNKTLDESCSNGVAVHLFEVFEKGNYVYQGEVVLSGEPYTESQPDIDGNNRNAVVFPLKLKHPEDYIPIDEEIIRRKEEKIQKQAQRLPTEELKRRAKYSRKGVGNRLVSTTTYERNPYVALYAKRRANGVCQLCGNKAPFSNKTGDPYLETHHIEWLAKGGDDTIENTVALCPNCHRKMHILDLESDRVILKSLNLEY